MPAAFSIRADCGQPPRVLSADGRNSAARRLTIPAGHGLERPIVMDATVDQRDGYRFVYCLPFSATELFVEDTYYSDTPDLDPTSLEARIADYAAAQGWHVTAARGRKPASSQSSSGGLRHLLAAHRPPGARRGARRAVPSAHQLLAPRRRALRRMDRRAGPELDARLGPATRARAERHWNQGRFDRLLARMLFRAADPAERYRILERFYRLPDR